jgi:UDP:flavonoid glycosyltransferase YjiC (YdhE family)
MARVLFINGGSEGHVNPTIGVVQELISRGEEVVYFCIEAFRERMEKRHEKNNACLKVNFKLYDE